MTWYIHVALMSVGLQLSPAESLSDGFPSPLPSSPPLLILPPSHPSPFFGAPLSLFPSSLLISVPLPFFTPSPSTCVGVIIWPRLSSRSSNETSRGKISRAASYERVFSLHFLTEWQRKCVFCCFFFGYFFLFFPFSHIPFLEVVPNWQAVFMTRQQFLGYTSWWS